MVKTSGVTSGSKNSRGKKNIVQWRRTIILSLDKGGNKTSKKLEMELYISTGGVEIQDELYDIMTQLDALYISLNGSTEEVNQKSRDGFKAAKRMLFEAKKRGIKTRINWVARRDNVEDFPQLCKFAEDVGVEAIDILKK